MEYTGYKKSSPDITLWHYTSPEVFWAILGGSFYATHYSFMNDSAEILYGIDNCKKFWENKFPEYPEINEIITNLEKKDFYLMCFSCEKDSLYQWRSYANHGGFSIGFSQEKLCLQIENYLFQNKMNLQTMIGLFGCKYLPEETISRYLRWLYHKLWKPFAFTNETQAKSSLESAVKAENISSQGMKDIPSGSMKNDNPWEPLRSVCNAFLMTFILQSRCATIKNPSFEIEKEVRLVVTGDNLRKDLKLIGGKPRISIPLPDYRKCIHTVYISPHGDIKQNQILAELARDRFGLDFEIIQSKSSFNGK